MSTRVIPLSGFFRKFSKIIFLASLLSSLFLPNTALAADIYSFVYNVDPSEPQGPNSGRIKTLDFSYNATLKRLKVEILFEDFFGVLPNGFAIAINNGGEPQGDQGELAFIYLDASNPADLVLTAYAYNGKGTTYDSWKDASSVLSGDQAPDKIFSSKVHLGDVLSLVYSKNAAGDELRLGFEIDSTRIQNHIPAFPDTNGLPWEGARFDTTAGVWISIVKDLVTSYGTDGYLTNWQFSPGGWYDKNDIGAEYRQSICPDGDDTDTDGDRTPDCIDQCDNDPNKLVPGICGCGTADTDTDGDGTADCNESCDEDPNKLEPGICGCGVADTDTDGDQTPDCIDQCDDDPNKVEPGDCGCGQIEEDLNQNNISDCLEDCLGHCDQQNPDFDEDGDGVSNCDEQEHQTDACDPGDFREQLEPELCAGANFFLGQTNIAAVISQSQDILDVTVTYRDLFGFEKGDVTFWLFPGQRFDVIVNDLGAEPDTYGTVCVRVHTDKPGEWYGHLTSYKPRFGTDGAILLDASGAIPVFDFALMTPFANPTMGISTASLNTNPIGDAGKGSEVANWVRVTDAIDGDGLGLKGAIFYYDIDGKTVGLDIVKLPDGGRFDFAAHAKLGSAQVGIAEFIPEDLNAKYYLDVSRYFYEGSFQSTSGNFFTAFNLPIKPATGLKQYGFVSTIKNELAIVEAINNLPSQVVLNLGIQNALGSFADSGNYNLRPKSSFHRIITGAILPAAENGAASASSTSSNSINAMTLNYLFDDFGELLLAYAPDFTTRKSAIQKVDFNSFLDQVSRLNLNNQSADSIDATITIADNLGNLIDTFVIGVKAGETQRITLSQIPKNLYGSITIDTAGKMGLIVRNDVIREDEYVVTFPGR